MSRPTTLRGLPTFGAAAAGVLTGHWLAYLLTHPLSPQRDGLLARTGHAYLPTAVQVGLIMALAGLGTLVLRRMSTTGRRERPAGVVALWTRLWAIQSSVFVTMELTERLAASAPVAGVMRAHLLLVGLAVQGVVSIVCALVLRWLHHAQVVVALGADRTLPAPRRAVLGIAAHLAPRPALQLLAGTAGARGPPPA